MAKVMLPKTPCMTRTLKPLFHAVGLDDESYTTDHSLILQLMFWIPHAISKVCIQDYKHQDEKVHPGKHYLDMKKNRLL